jgi:hypothetical protein
MVCFVLVFFSFISLIVRAQNKQLFFFYNIHDFNLHDFYEFLDLLAIYQPVTIKTHKGQCDLLHFLSGLNGI